jgi:hypothetical protein
MTGEQIVESASPQVPAHVPAHLVIDFDIYNPPGAQQD